MYNRKVLIDALKKLGSAKAPSVKKDNEYFPYQGESYFSMTKGGEAPYKKVSVQKSNVQGKGLFADEPIGAGEVIGLSHTKFMFKKNGEDYIKSQETPIIGKYYNHSDDAFNVESIVNGNKRYLRAIRDINPGEEILGNYYEDDDPTLESPDDFKKGGSAPKLPKKKNSKGYSRSLEATNRLFAEHPLFAKPKSRKKKIYDPKSKYYRDGGTAYANLPAQYESFLQGFEYPNVVDDPTRTGYNSVNNTISYDSQSPIENMDNDWWREHEMFHHLQNISGGMSTSGILGQRPNPYVASDESMRAYYDRRDADIERTIDAMIAQNPDLQFIPRDILRQGRPGLVGAEQLQYSDPTTLEGEARQYEQYIEAGNPSIFPQKREGGVTQDPCPPGYIWNGLECVVNPFETSPSDAPAIYVDNAGNYLLNPVYDQFSRQQQSVQESNKKAQDFNKEYAQSKNYKRLLKKQGYTPEEIQNRVNSVSNINDFRYIDEGPSWVGADENTGNEFISYNVTDKGDWPGFDQIAAHEWGHVGVDSGANPLKPKEREEFINRIKKDQAGVTGNPDDLIHDMEPQENRADLTQLRQQLQESGLFDSTKRKKFTAKDLQKYKKQMESSEDNWNNMWNRMFRLYDDKDIIWFMNNVAQNDSNEDMQVAKYGIQVDLTPEEIEQYAKGGYIIEDISIPSLTKAKKGGLIKAWNGLTVPAKAIGSGLKTLGKQGYSAMFSDLRPILYKSINPASYAIADKLKSLPKEIYKNTVYNDTRPFRVGESMLLGLDRNLNTLLNRHELTKDQYFALSDPERAKLYKPLELEQILNKGKRRLDAWAVGLKLPQEYGTLEQVGDDTYRMKNLNYTPDFFSERYTDLLADRLNKSNILYSGEDPLITLSKNHYDLTKHPFLQIGNARDPMQQEIIEKWSSLRRSQIDDYLGYKNDFQPWTQKRAVGLSTINPDKSFTDSIWDNDTQGVMGGFRWDIAETPEGIHWQANDRWDINPFEKRSSAYLNPDEQTLSALNSSYFAPLKGFEALSAVGGRPFSIKNNFLVEPKTFKILKEWEDGGETDYELGDEVDEATMQELKRLGYTFEKI